MPARPKRTEEEEHIGEGDREFSGEAEQEQAAASVSTETTLDLGDRNTGPKQVKLAQYPQSVFGTQKRAFQFNWFQSFNWLEYSCKRDAAFCYAYRVFGRNLKQDVFVSGGVKNWRKALSFYHKHESSQSHKDRVIRWQSYNASLLKGSVVQQIESATSTEVQERREYLKRIVAVTSLLGKQGIPFRGHDESCESHDKGMFAECFKLVQKFDPFLKLHSSTEHHISFKLQSECGMSKERFLALTELMGFDAESIANTTEQQLALNGIGDLKCVAQTYDGAAVMSGAVGDVQAHFRKKHPEAVYVHCYAHELNLVLCHTCRAISEAREFFEILESVYSFFSSSLVNHHKFVETQTRLGLQQTELVQLSSTRWACQLRSVNCVLDNFPAIIECLLGINTPLAVGLRVKLCKFSSVFALLYLQKENIDLARAMEYKNAVTDSLKEKRSDSTAALALHYNIDLKPAEVMVASNFFKRKNETGATVQAALTIPVSSCSCERSFGASRRLHTWLRTMGQNRLHHLAVMSIEKELLDSISPDIVIDRFANLKVRRHRLVLPK
ncbi:zinc finger MYM-type protein 1 [Brachyhypopomus gauderio]|uniref:zinc finger MYM-type protein 1 n=1 Tax=Brachyhypopomus gauderio TaxID=698409 RepID=UPI004043703E